MDETIFFRASRATGVGSVYGGRRWTAEQDFTFTFTSEGDVGMFVLGLRDVCISTTDNFIHFTTKET